jgi:hypothetical protein
LREGGHPKCLAAALDRHKLTEIAILGARDIDSAHTTLR